MRDGRAARVTTSRRITLSRLIGTAVLTAALIVPSTTAAQDSPPDLEQWRDPYGNILARISWNGSFYGNYLHAWQSLNLWGATERGRSTRMPLVNFWSDDDLKWQIGLDIANAANDDLVLAARGRGPTGADDMIYLREYPDAIAIGMESHLRFQAFEHRSVVQTRNHGARFSFGSVRTPQATLCG
jgi:hypothetical protein